MTALPDDVRDLLQAMHDALDIPRPANVVEDWAARDRLMTIRAEDVRIQLASLLRSPLLSNPADMARQLRTWTEQSPVTYTPKQDEAGEPE